jgi:hypothetical protein
MKSAQNRAVTRCFKEGIAISGGEFKRLVWIYNNGEMPISKRVMMIARGWDTGFIEFLKEKRFLKSFKERVTNIEVLSLNEINALTRVVNSMI